MNPPSVGAWVRVSTRDLPVQGSPSVPATRVLSAYLKYAKAKNIEDPPVLVFDQSAESTTYLSTMKATYTIRGAVAHSRFLHVDL